MQNTQNVEVEKREITDVHHNTDSSSNTPFDYVDEEPGIPEGVDDIKGRDIELESILDKVKEEDTGTLLSDGPTSYLLDNTCPESTSNEDIEYAIKELEIPDDVVERKGLSINVKTNLDNNEEEEADTLLTDGPASLSEEDVELVRLVYGQSGLPRYSYHRSMVDRLLRSWQHVDSDADETLLLNERTPPCGEIAVSGYDEELGKLLSDEPPLEQPKPLSLEAGKGSINIYYMFHSKCYPIRQTY